MEEGKHGRVPFYPFLEPNGDTKGSCTSGDGSFVRACEGSRAVLPANEGEYKVLHGIDRTEVVNIGGVEAKCGRT